MGKIIILLLLFSASQSANKSIFNDIKNVTEMKGGEYVIALYQSAGSCIKCYYQPMGIVEAVMKKLKHKENIKILAFVSCNRKKEMKVFKKQFDWKHYMLIDKGNIRKDLGIHIQSAITVFNDRGEIILNIIDQKYEDAPQKLYDILKF